MQNQEKRQQQRPPAEAVMPPPDAPPSTSVTQPDALTANTPIEPTPEDKLASVEQRANELQDAFLRAKADLENFRRRANEDVARAHKFAIESFSLTLLPVKDSLETALKVEQPSIASLKEGVEMTLRQLDAAFKKNWLTEINPMPGDKFDPTRYETIAMVPAEQKANTIVSVLQKGYMIAGRLLRPALVTVAQAKIDNNDS